MGFVLERVTTSFFLSFFFFVNKCSYLNGGFTFLCALKLFSKLLLLPLSLI